MSSNGKLKQLSEESLTRQPEEVFDIICKLGEGSYGSVYKALHKESEQVVAIKQVPVDTDLQEIIIEISFMQQCDSPYVVKYYGSYFKNTDLWIIMEYCGAGSVSDIIKLRKKTLTEDEIATILCDILKGLEYLHSKLRIHRDIKAANILLNSEGHAKLADFGVAGQLTDNLAKRNTVTGTPFWMAPEVIQEMGYNCAADIWSLGITALEMAEGKPPYGDIHPMRAVFMVPTKPPPSFREPDKWSPEFIDFVGACLLKNPDDRATASQLLRYVFISNAKSPSILYEMIEEVRSLRENRNPNQRITERLTESTNEDTLVLSKDDMVLPITYSKNSVDTSELELGTMVVNSDVEVAQGIQYRAIHTTGLQQIEAKAPSRATVENELKLENLEISPPPLFPRSQPVPFINNKLPNFEYLKHLNYEELQQKMAVLDAEMELEIDELRRRYQIKRQPMLDAIDNKRRRQQHF